MAGTIGLLDARHALPVDQIELFFDQPVDHGRGRGGIVGVVAVDHDVDVRLDIGEHPPHDIAFSRQGLAPHDRTGCGRGLAGPVRGVVVVNVDLGARQCVPEVLDHLGDRGFLVEAGHDNRDVGFQYVQCTRLRQLGPRQLMCPGY